MDLIADGMNGVATTESGTNAHPILRASSSGLYSPIQYNVLNTPAQATVFATTSSAARGLTSTESHQSAFLPPVPSKSVSVRLYPRNAQPINYNWSVTLTGPRRSSAPPSPAARVLPPKLHEHAEEELLSMAPETAYPKHLALHARSTEHCSFCGRRSASWP